MWNDILEVTNNHWELTNLYLPLLVCNLSTAYLVIPTHPTPKTLNDYYNFRNTPFRDKLVTEASSATINGQRTRSVSLDRAYSSRWQVSENSFEKKKPTCIYIYARTQSKPENSTRTRVKLRRVPLTVLVCREISAILEGLRLPSLSRQARFLIRRSVVMYTSHIAARAAFDRRRISDRESIQPLWRSLRRDEK